MLNIYFFIVGHGDSIAIEFPNKEWGIIDCNRNKNEENPQVLNFLKRKQIKYLNFICITHPHTDHFNGIDMIVEYYKDNINKLILYGLTKNDKEISDKNSLGRALKIFMPKYYNRIADKLLLITRGESINIGEVNIKCLNPTEAILNELRMRDVFSASKIEYNNSSVVLNITYKTYNILLTGDATANNMDEIQDYLKEKPNILKISHHGSRENNIKILPHLLNTNTYTIISTDNGIKYKSLPSTEIIEYINNICTNETILTSDLTINKSTQDINNFIKNDVLEAVIDESTQDCEIIKYDGLIHFSINEQGIINKRIYKTLNDFFVYNT